jgi:hypothetical protein
MHSASVVNLFYVAVTAEMDSMTSYVLVAAAAQRQVLPHLVASKLQSAASRCAAAEPPLRAPDSPAAAAVQPVERLK